MLFFLVVYFAYVRLGHRGQNLLLLVSSCAFYGYSDARFLALVFVSAGLDYVCSHRIAESADEVVRLRFLRLAIAGNLAILGFFKYHGLFVASWNIALPAGISFYTFQSMSYTIDVYRGTTRPCRSPLDFAIAVMFFPHLVAGPIQRAGNLIEQVSAPRALRAEQLRTGLWRLARGYLLKVVVADNAAHIADGVFAEPDPTGARALLGVYAFALQIYGDFAGYSSIARGLANLMGFELMVNFRQPYLAQDPSDFWRRWHVSLSTWLRDYLYIPLGGNRAGRTTLNLVITMVLGGLWHGAAGKYALWGLYHGLLLVAYRALPVARPPPPLLRRFTFFHLACFGWLIFRCDRLAQVVEFPRAILAHLAWTFADTETLCALAVLAAPVIAMDLANEHTGEPDGAPRRGLVPLVALCALAIFLFGVRGGRTFIYFRF